MIEASAASSRLIASLAARKANFRRSLGGINSRAEVARSDEMLRLPASEYARIIPQVERAIDVCESPIEQVAFYQIAGRGYGEAETRYLTVGEVGSARGIVVTPQAAVAQYRVDFLLSFQCGRRLAVECDGAAYHDSASDARRDEALEGRLEISRVIRVKGSEIWRGPQWTDRVNEAIKGMLL